MAERTMVSKVSEEETPRTSRISGFHALGREQRIERVSSFAGLEPEHREQLAVRSNIDPELADHMIENLVTTIAIPVGIATNMRVSAITDVQRRSDGMRVKGLIDSGVDYRGSYGGQAYQGTGGGGEPDANRHPSNNDLVFRCNLDAAGLVSSLHVERHTTTYRRY